MKTAPADKTLTYREVFRQARDHEDAWVRYATRRENALDVLVRDGLETRGHEDWVHGSPGALAAGDALPLHGPNPEARPTDVPALTDSHLLVFVNGVYAPEINASRGGRAVGPRHRAGLGGAGLRAGGRLRRRTRPPR